MRAVINAADSAICSVSPQALPGINTQFSWYQARHALQLAARALPFRRGQGGEASSIGSLPREQAASLLCCAPRGSEQGSGFFTRTREQGLETFQLNSKPFLRKGNLVVHNCMLYLGLNGNGGQFAVILSFLEINKSPNQAP